MTLTSADLRKRMLADISDDYDKSEGSFFFDAISPVAIELEKSYENQNIVLSHAFAGTATGEYLERKCSEMGIKRKKATKATGIVSITGAKGANIGKGIYVSTELTNFITTESAVIGESGTADISVECTEAGTLGNVAANTIKFFPMTIEGLNTVCNSQAFTNGYDDESDDSLRDRYYNKTATPATSGNAAHYEQWAKSINGVGNAKVFPTWNGAGTVRVVICSSNKRAADQKLINETKEYIEKERPIGANVTVESVTEKQIDITANLVLSNGAEKEKAVREFNKKVEEYLKELALVSNYVSYAKIGSILYDLESVADYSELKINQQTKNIPLSDVEIPVVGTVVLS
ncbi:MAG: baseplate J/gp47 family protein [Aminipila sp.]